MLVIRKEQIEVFSSYLLKQYIKNIELHLRSIFPKQTENINQNELSDIINLSIRKAQTYNIISKYNIERFLEYMIKLNPDFDTDEKIPRVSEILQTTGLTGNEKMDLIDEHCMFLEGSIYGR